VGASLKAGVEQSHTCTCFPWLSTSAFSSNLTLCTQVLVITMALSFGIDDYIEGGVITAVILLNIVVG
jgi:hypothetical protein